MRRWLLLICTRALYAARESGNLSFALQSLVTQLWLHVKTNRSLISGLRSERSMFGLVLQVTEDVQAFFKEINPHYVQKE